jgi:phosphohistidine phosphatase SixA
MKTEILLVFQLKIMDTDSTEQFTGLSIRFALISFFVFYVISLNPISWANSEEFITQTAEPVTPDVLFRRLREGGYVIFLRHALTDHSQVDSDRNDLSSCETQRNLSKKGREQARRIGETFTIHRIPIDKVLTSPYCRAKDTATLAFGRARVTEDLRFGMGTDENETLALAQALRTMFSTPPEAGRNTVLVSHTANLQEAVGIWPRHEGGAYIFQPLDEGEFNYIGNIPPTKWISEP